MTKSIPAGMRDLPTQIESWRLRMRPPRMGDGQRVNEAIRESFAELTLWMPWARQIPSVPESETFVREAAARFRTREDLTFLIFPRTEELVLGAISLHHIDWDVPKFEIGYWLRTSQVGNGYVTEAVLRVTEFAFSYWGAQRMEIRCDANNTRSAAVAVRAGYLLEATLHHDARTNAGALRDTQIYARFPPV